MSSAPRPITLHRADGVAHVALSRPERGNALDDAAVAALIDVLDELAADPNVAALVLSAEGRHFSVGGDLDFLSRERARLTEAAAEGAGDAAVDAFAAHMRGNARLTEKLLAAPFPTTAIVQGACVGAALALVGSCDVRLARPDARIVTGYGALALTTDFGVEALLRELVGDQTAACWLREGPGLTAREGLEAGFFTGLLEGSPVAPSADEVQAVAGRGPAVLERRTRARALSRGPRFGDHLDAEARRFAESLVSEEAGPRLAAATARGR